jgi:hypothetical protein
LRGRRCLAAGVLTLAAMRSGAQAPVALTTAQVRAMADSAHQLRVIVSIAERRLWVLSDGGETLRVAPVAVGSGRTLRSLGHSWTFQTPRGVRNVLSAEIDPVWIRPDWAYVELARQRKLRLDSVRTRQPVQLADGRRLEVRGKDIGISRDSSFTVWPVMDDIVIAGVLYVPPIGSPYRAEAGVLGRYRLNLGNAVGLHGTNDKASIGKAVTHGCMRLSDEDIEWLYLNIPVGTAVYIY